MSSAVAKPDVSPTPPKASFLRTIKAVAWSFIGIRKNSEYREDLSRLNPLHVIVIGIAGVLLFVLLLVVLVNWVVAK
jgi:amino acid transporter